MFRYPQEIWEEIFYPIMSQDPERWAIFITTPKGQNYFFKLWNEAQQNKEWYTSLLRATDTDIIPKDELEKAREAMLPTLFNQEMMCSFIADEECTLITSRMIDDLKSVAIVEDYNKNFASLDVAFGGDELVCYAFHDTKVVDALYLYTRDPDKIYSQVTRFLQKNEVKDIVYDKGGVGWEVGDNLDKLGFKTHAFLGSEKAKDPRFKNLRAEAWWYTMHKINSVQCWYPKEIELIQQLSSVRFLLREPFQLEPKEVTKKRLGRSPDRADAFVMGIWFMQFVKNELEQRKFYVPPTKKIASKNKFGWS
jgi:hypothetical protein